MLPKVYGDKVKIDAEPGTFTFVMNLKGDDGDGS